MQTTNDDAVLVGVAARTAREVCQSYQPKDEVLDLLEDNQSPAAFLELLVARGKMVEAVQFLAQALRKREAVWWACTCVRWGQGPQPAPKAAAALAAAERWVREPSEANRRTAEAAAKAASGTSTPAGCAAQAAFWSGESLAPAGQSPVPPAPGLAGSAVFGAVLLASVLHNPTGFKDNLAALLDLGVVVAAGEHRWEE